MPTFFEKQKSFKDVTIDGDDKINTSEFLEAAKGVVALFDIIGPTAFAAVIKDMNGNIRKITERQTAEPEKSATLQDLCDNELADKSHTATEGLVWLNRGLEFTAQALRNNRDDPAEELTKSFNGAYENTLKKHHGFAVKTVFSLAMKACPYRADFYKKLGEGEGDDAKVQEQLGEWLAGLEKIVGILNSFLPEKKW